MCLQTEKSEWFQMENLFSFSYLSYVVQNSDIYFCLCKKPMCTEEMLSSNNMKFVLTLSFTELYASFLILCSSVKESQNVLFLCEEDVVFYVLLSNKWAHILKFQFVVCTHIVQCDSSHATIGLMKGLRRRNTTEPQPDQLSKFWIEQILCLTYFYKPSTQLGPITHTHGGGPQLPFHLKISRCVSQKPKQHFRHQHRHAQRVFKNSELTVFFALISSWIHTITAFWYLYCSQSCWTV